MERSDRYIHECNGKINESISFAIDNMYYVSIRI